MMNLPFIGMVPGDRVRVRLDGGGFYLGEVESVQYGPMGDGGPIRGYYVAMDQEPGCLRFVQPDQVRGVPPIIVLN